MLREALSTTPPHSHERSGSTPHDNLKATTPKSRSPVCSLLSQPRLSSLQRCVHYATATPIFRYTQPPRPQKRAASERRRYRHYSPDRASDLTCGPPTAKIPIAESAAPPTTCPFPPFRPFQLFERPPSPARTSPSPPPSPH